MSIQEALNRTPVRELHKASLAELTEFSEFTRSQSLSNLQKSKALAKLQELKTHLEKNGFYAHYGDASDPVAINYPYQIEELTGLNIPVFVGKEGVCEVSLEWAESSDYKLDIIPFNRISLHSQPASGDVIVNGQEPFLIRKIDWSASHLGEKMVEDAIVAAYRNPLQSNRLNPSI